MIWRTVTFLSVSLIGGWIGVMASDRELPTTVYETRSVPETVRPGGTLEIEFHALRRRSCTLHVVRYIYDAHGVRHVMSDLDFPQGALPVGVETYRVPIEVPKKAAPGPAVYQSVNTYTCNLLQFLWPITDPREAKFTIEQ